MKRKRPSATRAAPPTPPAAASLLPAALTLKLDPDTRVQVALLPPEAKPLTLPLRTKTFVWIVTVMAIGWFALYVVFVAPRSYQAMQFSGSPINVALAHPSSAAFGDEGELDLTVQNNGNEPFTGSLTVIFAGNVAAHPLPSETTTIKIEALNPAALATHRVKFALPQQWRLFSGEQIRVGLQTNANAQRFRSTTEAYIRVAPIPLLRTFNRLLFGSTVVMAVVALLARIFVKHLLRWEEK